MTLNPTINYLLAKKSVSAITFARQLNNTTAMLYGPGQLDTVGVPIPCYGKLKRLTIYDSNSIHTVDCDVDIDPGDLVSVQAQFNNTAFTIAVMKNLSVTDLSISGVAGYRAIWASVLIELVDPSLQ